MCSSVWSRLSPVFSWKYVCCLYPLQHDSSLKQTFRSKVFVEKWNGNEKPKKNNSEKRVGKGQVVQPNGTSCSTWDKWDKEKGVFRSSWDKWDKDKGSVHLNHSTCVCVALFY